MSLKSILASEGLIKTSKLHISPKVVVTPVMQAVITAYEKLFFAGSLQNKNSGVVSLYTYTEGYVTKTIPAEYGSYPSVGGDYEIGYVKSDPRTEKVRKFLSLEVTFFPDGKIMIALNEPSTLRDGRFDTEEKILVKSRGFGPAGMKALIEAKKTFDFWNDKFV